MSGPCYATPTMFSSLRQLCKTRVIIQFQRIGQFAKTAGVAAASASRFLVQEIERNNNSGMLHVTWNNKSVNRFPFIYLRDNCRCSECFHESSLQRRFDTVGSLDLNISPQKLEVTQDGEQLVVTWPDGHVSVFDSEWLHSRRLSEGEDSSKERSSLSREGVEIWDAEKLQGNIPNSDFQEVMQDDRALFDWLFAMHSVGIALVRNTPLEVGQVEKLCDRVGHSKTTHYGHTFEVKAKYDPSNVAYTTDGLPLHTDMPYYDYVPGAQMLHCIEQAPGAGGANQFVDGFHVAKVLRDKDPKTFDLLTTERFQFFDTGKDQFGHFDLKFSRKLIELDENQQLSRFNCNNPVRDSIMHVTPERTIEMYEAYLTIGKMLIDPANQIEHKMEPGDTITFNNARVLHGRSEFTITDQESRFLIGIFLDWDIIYSRMRVLAKTFNIPFHC